MIRKPDKSESNSSSPDNRGGGVGVQRKNTNKDGLSAVTGFAKGFFKEVKSAASSAVKDTKSALGMSKEK